MEKFVTVTAKAAVLDRPNIDTDLIIPKQFLKSTERDGFGKNLFNDLRFLPNGQPDPNFILNEPRYLGAGVLVSRENFGSGSSREHAPWALMDYGFKAIICPTFADIFKSNSFKNGLLLIELENSQITDIINRVIKHEGYQLTIDLPNQNLKGTDGLSLNFEIDPYRKTLLVNGWDDISLTMQKETEIKSYEKNNSRPFEAAVPCQL